jgi:hypothetical protein
MAQVSGIEVRFSGNTADLEKSVGRANSAISGFAKSAAAALAGALSVGAFVAAGKAAINYADNIGKMSQKIGMTAEELSKLNYAAKLSDVSLGELQVSVQQLSKNMEAGSDGLDALGISATDASGNLRSTNEVFLEVAEAIAGLEDGAGKTAIMMNIFGRSGAQLIPMMNAGRAGLAQMGDEARRFGVVISGDASKAAETFNDNLTRFQEISNGLAQEIMRELLPTINDLLEGLLKYVEKSGGIQSAISGIKTEFSDLARVVTASSDALDRLKEWSAAFDDFVKKYGPFSNAAQNGFYGLFDNKSDDPSGLLKSIDDFGKLKAEADDLKGILDSIELFGGDKKNKAPRIPGDKNKDKGKEIVPGVAPSQEVGMFFIDRLEAIRDGFKSEREMLEEEYNLNRNVLQNALLNERITKDEFMALDLALAKEHADALAAIQQASISQQLSDLSSGFGSMASAFQNGGKKMLRVSKAFAAAQAIVATIQAAVDAMKNPALIDPASKFAAYAAVFAKGMSAVAAIRGVSDSGGGGGGGGGGGRGGGRGGGGSSAPAAASPTTTFQFTLMNDPMGFGEKFARQFIDQLNATQRNGGQIRGVIA